MTNSKYNLSFRITDEDLANGIKDDYGLIYSQDGTRLLKCTENKRRKYVVKAGTTVLCYGVFQWARNVTSIILPEGLKLLGGCSFSGCRELRFIILPDEVTYIDKYVFSTCVKLTFVSIPESIEDIHKDAFFVCENLKKIYIRRSSDADEAVIREKFKKLLPEPLYDKIEIF